MTMQKQRGSANSEIKQTERRSEDEDYSPIPTTNSITKVQKKEYLIKNACYSPAKYYLCKQNNKRSLLGRKQRSQVVRSFLNRYQFSYINKVISLFSIRYTLIIILQGERAGFEKQQGKDGSRNSANSCHKSIYIRRFPTGIRPFFRPCRPHLHPHGRSIARP